ncbi:hypothetical protein [Sphingopyxis sp. 550A]
MADMVATIGRPPVEVHFGENTVAALAARSEAAASAAAAALSEATAESVAGPTYPDTSTGLAATTNGQSFAVDNGDGTVTVYLNDNGSAVAQRTLATTAALASSSGALMVGLAAGDKLQERADGLALASAYALIGITPYESVTYIIAGYHPDSVDGGGMFRWSESRPKADHDGVIVIDPSRPWPADWAVDGDVAAWFTAGVSGTGCFVRQDVTTLTPEMAGALPSPAVSTRQFDALAVAMQVCRKARFKSSATYRTERFHPPVLSFVDGNAALIERSAPSGAALVVMLAGSTVEDLNVDGRYGDGVASSSLREKGIALYDNCTARRCTARRNYSHGIGNDSVAIQLEYENILIEDCYGYENGANPNPDGSGTGDGIALVNCHNSKIVRSGGDANARSGVTATTYDTSTGTTDNSLSTGVIFEDVYAYGNAYAAAINAEHVSAPKFLRPRTDAGVSFNNSENAYVDRPEAASISGTGVAHYPIIMFPLILNSARGHELISLTGNSPTVIGGTVTVTFVSPTGSVVQILPADRKGAVSDLIVIGGNNGYRLDVSDFSGLRCDTAANLGIIEGPSGASRNIARTQMPIKLKGVLRGFATAAPTTGTWNRGDSLENTSPSAAGKTHWICTTAGVAGSTAVFKAAGAIDA